MSTPAALFLGFGLRALCFAVAELTARIVLARRQDRRPRFDEL